MLARVSGVTDLSLRGCQQLSDEVTPALAALPNLCRLDLRACERFTGKSALNASAFDGSVPIESALVVPTTSPASA